MSKIFYYFVFIMTCLAKPLTITLPNGSSPNYVNVTFYDNRGLQSHFIYYIKKDNYKLITERIKEDKYIAIKVSSLNNQGDWYTKTVNILNRQKNVKINLQLNTSNGEKIKDKSKKIVLHNNSAFHEAVLFTKKQGLILEEERISFLASNNREITLNVEKKYFISLHQLTSDQLCKKIEITTNKSIYYLK